MVMIPRYDNDKNSPRFAIMVSASPYEGLAAESALGFAKAVVELSHRLSCVYFYHDAVLHACEMSADLRQHSLSARWAELAAQAGVPLWLCQAAGERRGLASLSLPDGFEWGGLARFFSVLDAGTRVASFGRCSRGRA